MAVPILSELREPPIVGRFYMVPVVRNYPWHGRRADWPVLGPLHTDADIFGFDERHYHLDIRFLSSRTFRFVAERCVSWYASGDAVRDAALVASYAPLSYRHRPLPKGRPPLIRMQCRRSHLPPTTLLAHHQPGREKMLERYGAVAQPIRLSDGRLLCPHQKVDLSQFEPDADGIVTCPLHGLRVRCAAATSLGSPAPSAAPVLSAAEGETR